MEKHFRSLAAPPGEQDRVGRNDQFARPAGPPKEVKNESFLSRTADNAIPGTSAVYPALIA
jgi:hypothetical protein